MFDFGYTLADYRIPPADGGAWVKHLDVCLGAVGQLLEDRTGTRLCIPKAIEQFRVRRDTGDHREIPLGGRLARACAASEITLDPRLLPELVEAFYEPITATCRAYPDSAAALEALVGRGLKVGILSNSPWGAPGICGLRDVDRAELTGCFDTMVFSGDTRYRKPAPEIFRMALEGLGLPPERVIFVGDDYARDIVGARGVGMRTVLRRVPGRNESAHGAADWEIDQCGELLGIVAML